MSPAARSAPSAGPDEPWMPLQLRESRWFARPRPQLAHLTMRRCLCLLHIPTHAAQTDGRCYGRPQGGSRRRIHVATHWPQPRILGAASLAVETAAASVPVEDEQAWREVGSPPSRPPPIPRPRTAVVAHRSAGAGRAEVLVFWAASCCYQNRT